MQVAAHDDGRLELELSEAERVLLTSLSDELVVLLDSRNHPSDSGNRDPVIARLLPDAYHADDEAAAEFRRFTEDDLVSGKSADARVVARSLHGEQDVVLDPPAVRAWLRSLTDLRLALAVRLGIRHDGDLGDDGVEWDQARHIYVWLGYVQESLLGAIDTHA